jgi:hypothetical protein
VAVNVQTGGMDRRRRAWSVTMVLLGCAGLVLKRHGHGPVGELVWSYGGNIAASFAVFHVVGLLDTVRKHGRFAVAALALLTVSLFEVTDGFGVMSNTYDPFDLGANVVGVGLAVLSDRVASRATAKRESKGA